MPVLKYADLSPNTRQTLQHSLVEVTTFDTSVEHASIRHLEPSRLANADVDVPTRREAKTCQDIRSESEVPRWPPDPLGASLPRPAAQWRDGTRVPSFARRH